MASGRCSHRCGQFGNGGRRGCCSRSGHGSRNILLHHSAAALDDTDLALGFGDLEFRHIRLGYQIDEGFEFSQIHGSSNGYKTE